jgi:hypothetical protein
MKVAAIETIKLRICVTKVTSLLRLTPGRRKAVGAAFDDHTGLLQGPPNSVSTHEYPSSHGTWSVCWRMIGSERSGSKRLFVGPSIPLCQYRQGSLGELVRIFSSEYRG